VLFGMCDQLRRDHLSCYGGRVPTPKGYRFFVDSLMVIKPLEQVEIHRLEGEFTADRPQEGDVVVVTYAILGECD